MLTSDTSSAVSIAKKFTVVSGYGTAAPIFNKILDTGPAPSGPDFNVGFQMDGASNTKIKCIITPVGASGGTGTATFGTSGQTATGNTVNGMSNWQGDAVGIGWTMTCTDTSGNPTAFPAPTLRKTTDVGGGTTIDVDGPSLGSWPPAPAFQLPGIATFTFVVPDQKIGITIDLGFGQNDATVVMNA